MLCTIADIKARLGISDKTEFDAVLTQIAAGFTARADQFCGRTLLASAADVTEYYTGKCEYLRLVSYPIIAITSIKEAWDYNFDDAAALIANTDYRILDAGKTGLIARLYGDWCNQPDGIQVIARGGYCAAGVTPAAGEHALPDDLRDAAICQCSFVFKRKDDLGLSGVSFNGGSFNKFESLKLLPEVEAVLRSYIRLSI